MQQALQRFSPAQRLAMGRNVVLCGGGAMLAGTAERVRNDLCAALPAGATVKLWDMEAEYARPGPFGGMGGAVSGLAWRGAARFAALPDFGQVCVTRAEWLEKGPSYLCEHRCPPPPPPLVLSGHAASFTPY